VVRTVAVAPTAVARGDLSDPVRVPADEVPRVGGEVARDRSSVAGTPHPPVARRSNVGAAAG